MPLPRSRPKLPEVIKSTGLNAHAALEASPRRHRSLRKKRTGCDLGGHSTAARAPRGRQAAQEATFPQETDRTGLAAAPRVCQDRVMTTHGDTGSDMSARLESTSSPRLRI